MSPYIVTTRRPEGYYRDLPPKVVSRRAVATLEEAREAIVSAVAGTSRSEGVLFDARITYADPIPESGGTVGPLPDGTVIEVKQWEDGPMRAWANFYGPTDVTSASPAAEIIDAFNARQS